MSATVPSVALVPWAGAHLLAADAAFYGVFGVFVVAFGVLAFVSVRWGVRRDRAARGRTSPLPPPRTAGHGPGRPDRRGRERDQPG